MGVGRKMSSDAITRAVETKRANGGYTKSPETIAKLRAYWTDERKAALVERMRRPPSEETRQKMREAKLGKSRSVDTVDKFKATVRAKGPGAEAERVAKIIATSAQRRAAKSPQELAEAEERRQAKRRATEAAKSIEEKAAIRARAAATRKAKKPAEKAASAQKLRTTWAAKSSEETAEIGARRWATRRAKKEQACQQ
jgi:hypothetical protein